MPLVPLRSVLTEENIEAAYGVKSRVTQSFLGKPQVTPLMSEFDVARSLKGSLEIEAKHA